MDRFISNFGEGNKMKFGIYIRKLVGRWWLLLAFIPSVIGLFNFYFSFPEIILSWQLSLILFSILLIFAGYSVWNEEHAEKIKLESEIKENNDKKPKLSLSFEKNKKKLSLKNKIFERKLDESPGIKSIVNPSILKRFGENIRGLFDSPMIDEIHEAFLPIKFELHNGGEFIATDVSIDIHFPKELVLVGDLPKKGLPFLTSSPGSSLGRHFTKKNQLRLWCNKSQPPYTVEFEEVYVFSNETKKFKINYEIHSDELGSKGIKGELFIDAKPIKELREYTIDSELRRDQYEYDKLIEDKLKEALE
jgi:hypothetical protein